MHCRDILTSLTIACILTVVFFAMILITNAQVRQSTNYSIQADSINFAGGFSSSTNYALESTAGEVATGHSSSTNFILRAGYQQINNNNFISITAVSPVSMTPSIPGITGGTANGSTTVTVTTDSPSGYQLTISGSQSPALTKGAASIADYVPGGNPDFTFTINSGDAYFGYSPSGIDTVTRFKDDGASCNTGSGETALACWDGLDTVAETIAQSTSANDPDGGTTTVYFRVGIGGSVIQEAGIYIATTTLTAVSL